MADITNQYDLPTRLEDGPKKDKLAWGLGLFAFGQFTLMWLSVFKMLGSSGPMVALTATVIAAIAGGAAFSVNHLAITRGAQFAALNFKSALVSSVVAIMLVGGSISLSTTTGLIKDQTGNLRLQVHQAEVARVTARQNKIAVETTRAIPVLKTIVSDLSQKAVCEEESNCISKAKVHGRGTITIALEDKSARAANIVEQLENGELVRKASLKRLNEYLADYRKVLDSDALSIMEKRAGSQGIFAKIIQERSTLAEAIPHSLLLAYANELLTPFELEGRPVVSRKITTILSEHGTTLKNVLESIDTDAQEYPSFPRRTSVANAVAHIGYFLPIALVLMIAEIGLPLWLFYLAYSRLYWINYRTNPPTSPSSNHAPVTNFGDLLDFGKTAPKGDNTRRLPAPKGNHTRRNQRSRDRK